MNEECPVCGLRFRREPGYFLGAMCISYGAALVACTLIAAALWFITRWDLRKVTLFAVLLFLPFTPAITLFSRVLWIYFDRAIDPEPPNK